MPERLITTLDGKRGAFLLIGGLAYLFIGLSYVFASTPGRQAAFQWLPEFMTPPLLGTLWILGGSWTIIVALISRGHPRLENVAFAALMLCPTMWVVIYMGASILGTHQNGWISAVSYGLMALWVWVVSGWDNPTPPVTSPVPVVRGARE
ncbi:hypothetical protein [Kocuria rhizophila]|uniref:hypothetical protein n=1 Tax=Kocuria rhizophila TaxID=72000 RepID=UPI001EF58D40|nr:hypothetical protein [Kocuria rhizophila]